MTSLRILRQAGFLLPLLPLLMVAPNPAQQPSNQTLPEIHQLMREVHEHEKQFDKVRENYTYTSLQTTQNIDANGQVKKTETVENENFFVNGHLIARAVKKNGRPLDIDEQQKETERVAKLVEKAKTTPPDQPLEAHAINISRVPEIIARLGVDGPRSFLISQAARTPRPSAWPRTSQESCKARYGSMRPTAWWCTWKWVSTTISALLAASSPASRRVPIFVSTKHW
jgi:hypothetical protein